MLDGALVTCVLFLLVSGLAGVVRTAVRYHRLSPYKRYLRALEGVIDS